MAHSVKSENDVLLETPIPAGTVSLASILCTEELLCRPSRAPDYEKQNRALVALARALANSRDTILQTLAETILQVTESDSSGLSLLTTDDAGKRFYWPAIAGMWKPHVGGGTPRNFGPCGDVLDCNHTLLFRHFERRYHYLEPVMPPAEECLLIPFYVGGKAVGTIWAVMHTDRRKYDAEDERMMNALGQFASLAYQTLESIDDLKLQVAAREKAEAQLRELTVSLEAQVRVRTEELEERNKQLAASRACLAEEKLCIERSEGYLAEAQKLSHAGSWHLDIATGEIVWSQELYSILGLDSERTKPSHALFLDRIHPEDRSRVDQIRSAAVREKKDFEAEYRLLLPGDLIKYVHSNGHPRVNKLGYIEEYVGAVLDVTERKRAEENLKASEERHRVIVETASDAVISMDESGLIVLANPATARIFGHAPVELIGKPMTVLMPEFMRKRHDTGFRRYLATRQRHLDWQGTEVTAMRKNGEEFPVEVSFGKITSNGHTVFTGFIRDVSEKKRTEKQRRRSEAFLAEAQQLTRIGSFSWRVATDEITWSEHLYRIFEFEHAVPITIELISTRIHPEDFRLFHDLIERARRALGDFEFEHRLRMTDNSAKYLHVKAHGTRDQSGQLEYIGAIQDVTQRRLSEEALAKARSELAHVARVTSLGELTASIAHEINQPLAAVVTNGSASLRWLDANPPNLEEAREAMSRAVSEASRAGDVIANIRALLRNTPPQMDRLNVNEIIHEVLTLADNELLRGGVNTETELAVDVPCVRGDRVQLQQVVLNLIMNAIDAMTTGTDRPRKVNIKSARQSDGVLVQVQDSGVGLDPGQAERIFQPFFTTKPKGIGMGLSIGRSIVESHGGRLWATSSSSGGAIFQFTLPEATNERAS